MAGWFLDPIKDEITLAKAEKKISAFVDKVVAVQNEFENVLKWLRDHAFQEGELQGSERVKELNIRIKLLVFCVTYYRHIHSLFIFGVDTLLIEEKGEACLVDVEEISEV